MESRQPSQLGQMYALLHQRIINLEALAPQFLGHSLDEKKSLSTNQATSSTSLQLNDLQQLLARVEALEQKNIVVYDQELIHILSSSSQPDSTRKEKAHAWLLKHQQYRITYTVQCMTALDWAINKGYIEIAILLLKAGAPVTYSHPFTNNISLKEMGKALFEALIKESKENDKPELAYLSLQEDPRLSFSFRYVLLFYRDAVQAYLFLRLAELAPVVQIAFLKECLMGSAYYLSTEKPSFWCDLFGANLYTSMNGVIVYDKFDPKQIRLKKLNDKLTVLYRDALLERYSDSSSADSNIESLKKLFDCDDKGEMNFGEEKGTILDFALWLTKDPEYADKAVKIALNLLQDDMIFSSPVILTEAMTVALFNYLIQLDDEAQPPQNFAKLWDAYKEKLLRYVVEQVADIAALEKCLQGSNYALSAVLETPSWLCKLFQSEPFALRKIAKRLCEQVAQSLNAADKCPQAKQLFRTVLAEDEKQNSVWNKLSSSVQQSALELAVVHCFEVKQEDAKEQKELILQVNNQLNDPSTSSVAGAELLIYCLQGSAYSEPNQTSSLICKLLTAKLNSATALEEFARMLGNKIAAIAAEANDQAIAILQSLIKVEYFCVTPFVQQDKTCLTLLDWALANQENEIAVEMALILLAANASYSGTVPKLKDSMLDALLSFLIDGKQSPGSAIQLVDDEKATVLTDEKDAAVPRYAFLREIPKNFLTILVYHKQEFYDYIKKLTRKNLNDPTELRKSIALLEFCLQGSEVACPTTSTVHAYDADYDHFSYTVYTDNWNTLPRSIICQLFGVLRDGRSLKNDKIASDASGQKLFAKLNEDLVSLKKKLTALAGSSPSPGVSFISTLSLFAPRRLISVVRVSSHSSVNFSHY